MHGDTSSVLHLATCGPSERVTCSEMGELVSACLPCLGGPYLTSELGAGGRPSSKRPRPVCDPLQRPEAAQPLCHWQRCAHCSSASRRPLRCAAFVLYHSGGLARVASRTACAVCGAGWWVLAATVSSGAGPAGPPGTNYAVMKKAFDEGWGAVIAKTVSLDSSKVRHSPLSPGAAGRAAGRVAGRA